MWGIGVMNDKMIVTCSHAKSSIKRVKMSIWNSKCGSQVMTVADSHYLTIFIGLSDIFCISPTTERKEGKKG